MTEAAADRSRLYLLRHAKSAWNNPTLEDIDRPLSERGLQARRLIADYIAAQAIRPSLVICSPARRARDTLEALQAVWTPPVETRLDERIYEAAPAELLLVAEEVAGEHHDVMLIGHNPGLQLLALRLLAPPATDSEERLSAQLRAKFPTAALAQLSAEAADWRRMAPGRFCLRRFVKPRDLAA